MAPKVTACVDFVAGRAGATPSGATKTANRWAAIGSLSDAEAIIAKTAGTVPSRPPALPPSPRRRRRRSRFLLPSRAFPPAVPPHASAALSPYISEKTMVATAGDQTRC